MIEPEAREEVGGESACYAHLVCPECGAVVDQTHVAHPPTGERDPSERVSEVGQ
jgi:hypothetical protein